MLTHNELTVTRSERVLPRLPQVWSSLRVVQISDLHFYPFSCPKFYQRVSDQVNALQADLILMTGDVMHYGIKHLADAQAFLSNLEARLGRFAVPGNHDFYDGALSRTIEAAVTDTGFTVLRNQAISLERDGHRLWLAGLDDLWCGAPNLDRALSEILDPNDPVLMMAHNPLLFDPISHYPKHAVDVVFAGHTHGGHVHIPWLGPIYRHVFKMKYRYHWYEKPHPLHTGHTTCLHVTSGVGSAAFHLKNKRLGFYVCFPRFRYNTLPEIALIQLHAPN